MNNTDKLLRALIDALGFEVDRVVSVSYGRTIQAGHYSVTANPNTEYEFFPATNQMPHAEYKEVIRSVDYKVTKKESPLESLGNCVPLPIQSEAWGSVVEYLTNHKEDIETGTNDFDTLRPIWDWFNRNP